MSAKKIFMYKHFIYILLFFVIISCKNKADKKSEPGNNPSETPTEQENNTAHVPIQNFYKRLEGKIAGQDIVANFSKFEDKMFFNYYYVSQGMPIGLFENPEAKLLGDSIELIEYDMLKKGDYQESDNKWRIVITENGIAGKWISRNGKKVHDINLKESYPAGSHLFNVVGKSGSYPIIFKKDTVAATSDMMVMEPSDAATNNWFRENFIKNILGDSTETSLSLSQIIEKHTQNYFDEYKAEIDTMRMNNDFADTGTHYTLNYVNELNTNALYNDKDFVVIEVGNYSYFGGAHGLEGKTAVCYNMKQKKQMQLGDVLSIDSASLQKIVEKNFRARSGIKPNQPMTEILFENNLPANDNFYFTNKGLGFIYQPYEVAAYAVGILYVFIPYTDLKPYLNPQFAQQMQIE